MTHFSQAGKKYRDDGAKTLKIKKHKYVYTVGSNIRSLNVENIQSIIIINELTMSHKWPKMYRSGSVLDELQIEVRGDS